MMKEKKNSYEGYKTVRVNVKTDRRLMEDVIPTMKKRNKELREIEISRDFAINWMMNEYLKGFWE